MGGLFGMSDFRGGYCAAVSLLEGLSVFRCSGCFYVSGYFSRCSRGLFYGVEIVFEREKKESFFPVLRLGYFLVHNSGHGKVCSFIRIILRLQVVPGGVFFGSCGEWDFSFDEK